MKPASFLPEAHLFVCANRREADSPLGPGCSEAGEELFIELKKRVIASGLTTRVWVTRTACLGICPTSGAAVASYPKQQIFGEARVSDAPALLASTLGAIARGEK